MQRKRFETFRVGKINGQTWYTNGHFMFRGSVRGKAETMPDSVLQKGYEIFVAGGHTPIIFRRFEKRGKYLCAVFSNGTAIQKRYWKEAVRMGCEFFVGNRISQDFGRNTERYVICRSNDGIVGVICPVRS